MCAYDMLPEHAFKLFPINERNLLAVVRELAEHLYMARWTNCLAGRK